MCEAGQIDRARLRLNFPNAVEGVFSFLPEAGFQIADIEPTRVKFKKGDLLVNVYHGRRSYEVGFEIGSDDERFSLSALIRANNMVEAEEYRNPVATTRSALVAALQRVAELVRCYGQRALNGDPEYFAELREQRRRWSEAYALDVLAEQIRPKAEAAFREGRYRDAAELYGRMTARLTATEQKKLAVARKRS